MLNNRGIERMLTHCSQTHGHIEYISEEDGSRMLRRIVAGLTIAAGCLGGLAVLAVPAYAADVTIDATVNPGVACNETPNTWEWAVFTYSAVTAPASITAKTSDGGTIVVPRVTGGFGFTYAIQTEQALTGAAQAVIDETWDDVMPPPINGFQPPPPTFALAKRACPGATITPDPLDDIYAVGDTITVAGQLTGPSGPVSNENVTVFHTTSMIPVAVSHYLTTDASGRFSVDISARDPGTNSFEVVFDGGTADLAGARIDFTTLVAPAEAPTPDAALASTGDLNSGTFTVSGDGFLPSSDVNVFVYSTPQLITTVTTDGQGAFTTEITLPDSLVGDHTIVAVGFAEGSDGVSARYLGLSVNLPAAITTPSTSTSTAAATLPKTGAPLTAALLAGSGLVIAGTILLVIVRQRRGRDA